MTIGLSIYYVRIRKPTSKLKMLANIARNSEIFSINSTTEYTLGVSKTVAISIPGYLQLDLEKSIKISDKAEILGRGGTAKIIQAKLRDPKLIAQHSMIDIVVKIFPRDHTKFSLDSFRYEVMVMASLPKSPNLIELIGYCENPYMAIVMKDYPMNLRELYENTPVHQVIKDNVSLKVAKDIAKGMSLVHAKGIIHFDLKPANILVEFHEREILCVICDFGFANFVLDVQENIVKGVKQPSEVGITARYAAPELFRKVKETKFNGTNMTPGSNAEIDKKIDVYAFAMTLFYVLCQESPWKDLSTSEIEKCVVNGERPQFKSDYDSNCEPLVQVVRRSWSQDPAERPSFSEILTKYLE